jgi:hypothetical protein
MLNDKLQPFYQAVHAAILEVGNSAPRIADKVIEEAFPETVEAADREGAATMLRKGVIEFISNYLKRNSNAPLETQGDFSQISSEFADIVGKLHSHSHYVSALEQHMPIGFLIANPEHLDDARQYKRQKGLETLAEADALDELYEAVTSRLI